MENLLENVPLQIIGIYALIWWCYENLKSIVQILISVLASFFRPQENKNFMEKYGKWAG